MQQRVIFPTLEKALETRWISHQHQRGQGDVEFSETDSKSQGLT